MQRVVLGSSLKLPRFELTPQMFKFSAVFAAIVLLTGLAMFKIQNPTVLKSSASSKSQIVVPSASPTAVPTMLGVNIANNGSVFIRGASVKSVSDNQILASVSWGSTVFSWVIQTTPTTKFLNHAGQKITISDIKVGDIVNVTGKLLSNENQFTINAEFIRE